MPYGFRGLAGTAWTGAGQAYRGGQGPFPALNQAEIMEQLPANQIRGALSRNLRRRGIDPNSPGYVGLQEEAGRTDAANQAGAMSLAAVSEQASRAGEFGRMMGAAGLNPQLLSRPELVPFTPANPTPPLARTPPPPRRAGLDRPNPSQVRLDEILAGMGNENSAADSSDVPAGWNPAWGPYIPTTVQRSQRGRGYAPLL